MTARRWTRAKMRTLRRFLQTDPPNWRAVLRRDPCCYCGRLPSKRTKGTLDHIVPRASGGPHNLLNLTGCCRDCNNAKANDSLLGFLISGGMGRSLPKVAIS